MDDNSNVSDSLVTDSGPQMDLSFDDTDLSLASHDSDLYDEFDDNNNGDHDDANSASRNASVVALAKASSSRKSRKPKRLCVSRTYGLRPRTQLRRPSYDCDSEEKEKDFIPAPRREPRGKPRSPVVAKCRRLTANARERQRMKEINTAFSTLRGVLPSLQSRPSSRVSMTKIRTLRLAASYIKTLSDLLSGSESKESTSADIDNFCDNLQHPVFVSETENLQDTNNFLDPTHEDPKTHPSSRTSYLEDVKDEQTEFASVNKETGWSQLQTSDEEFFSLLQKDVLNIRSQHHPVQPQQPPPTSLQDANPAASVLPDISWTDDLFPLGCK